MRYCVQRGAEMFIPCINIAKALGIAVATGAGVVLTLFLIATQLD